MHRSVLKVVARQASSVSTTLLGLLALTFFMGRMLPIDPVLSIVGDQADQSTYDMVHRQLGLDRPLYVQFFLYIRSMLSGDFGNALFTGHRVADDLMKVFPATVELATFAIMIGVGIGVPLGIVAAVYRGSIIDHFARVVGLLGYSSPAFWLGLMGLILFYATLGWVGGPGRLDVAFMDNVGIHTGFMTIDALWEGDMDVFWNAVNHLVLPGSILGYGSMAYISRMTRSFMLEQMAQEYILAARAKGLSGWAVIRRHAFRNILVQLVTVIALAYAFLLEGAVLTETVFAWPGFGHYLVAGLLAGDMNAVLACVLIVGVIFIGLNLITDLLYRLLDPRTR
jgi:peptide/nickel transport system permease protein